MSGEYLNPFGNNNTLNTASVSSLANVDTSNDNASSIMPNTSSTTSNYTISPSELNENEIELIKKELNRKVEEQKEYLENSKNTRGWLTSTSNSIKEAFRGGDKKIEDNISHYEELLGTLKTDVSNIDEIYKTITGTDLDVDTLQNLQNSETIKEQIDSQTQEAIIVELENQITTLETNFETARNSNGWISNTWNVIKNWSGIGASSNKTLAQINDLKEQIEKLKNGEADLSVTYKNITGTDLNYDNLSSLLSGKEGTGLDSISIAGKSLNNYTEGQKMCTDVAGDIISGIISVSAAAAAPVTGGASIAIAAGVGSAVKIGIKASDCIGNKKTYNFKDLRYDVLTGAINGAMGPITNGLGGAAGTGVAKAFGLKTLESTAKEGLEQAIKAAGKEVIEESAEQAGKSILTKILAKQGVEYILEEGAQATIKTTAGKFLAYGADMMVDGALSGATDGLARATAEGRFEDIPEEILNGLIGGAIASPIIGGSMRAAGKAGSTVINKINNKITISNLLPDGTTIKFSQGDMGDCALLSMIDGFLDNSKISKQIKNAITTTADGGYNVKIGSQTVKITQEELTDELLSDTTGIKVLELAYQKIGGSLDGDFAENVAKVFGLNPIHITSDGITDEVLESISKDSNNLILSLGAKVDTNGTITFEGKFQHYFSIKNINPKTKTLTLVDTYDTSKTFEMSFDDIKTHGISIDGGSIKKTDLPNFERNAGEINFKGSGDDFGLSNFLSNSADIEKILYDIDEPTIKRTCEAISKYNNCMVYFDGADDFKSVCKLDDAALEKFSKIASKLKKVCNYKELDEVLHLELDEAQYKRMLDLLDNGAGISSAGKFVTADIDVDNADKIIKISSEQEISGYHMDKLLGLNNNQVERFLHQVEKGNDIYDALELSSLSDIQYKRSVELSSMNVRQSDFANFYELDDAQCAQAVNLMQKYSLSAHNASSLGKLPKERFDKLIEIIDDDGYVNSSLLRLPGFNEAEYERFISLINKKAGTRNAVEAIEFDDIQFEKFETLLDRNIPPNKCIKAVKECDDAYYQRIIELADNGVAKDDVCKVAKFSDLEFERYQKLISQGQESACAMQAAQFDEARYIRYQEMISSGVDADKAIGFSDLNDEEYLRYSKLISEGIEDNNAYEIAKFDERQFEQYSEYIQNGIEPSCAESFVRFYFEYKDELMELSKKGLGYNEATEVIENCNGDRYKRTFELLENGVELDKAMSDGATLESYNKLMNEINSTPSAMREFLKSDDYSIKIKKAAQGKYQEQLMSFLDPANMTFASKKSLFESGLSEEEFLESVKKLSTSTYKFAMNTPNQYLSNIDIKYTTKIDGKYPKLKDDILIKQQRQISEFFSEHTSELTRALKYIDTDTINQMMDKRTIKFAKYLTDLDGLTDENYELLSKLIKCKSLDRSAKELTAKEKVQLCQIVEIYQKAEMDNSKLYEMSENGLVSLSSIKQSIQETILKSAGISDSELLKIPTDKLKLNEEFSYLMLQNENLLRGAELEQIKNDLWEQVKLFRNASSEDIQDAINSMNESMNTDEFVALGASAHGLRQANEKCIEVLGNLENYSNNELFDVFFKVVDEELKLNNSQNKKNNEIYTMIRESLLGDFSKFITDESNIYGKANIKTASAFAQNGIDYNKWLKPDIEDVELNIGGQKMRIKMWDRNPQEDLFVGNKTSCCTAIGTGLNADATPLYLSNTSYNVVELYDETGEVVGMSRIFMAKVNGKPSVIMDNIELNSNYKDTKATKKVKTQIRDGFFEYMNKFAQQITNDVDSQVYFYSGDIHVPKSDLSHETINLDFIGSLSHDKIYVNSARSWIDPKKLIELEDIDFLIVPK